MKWSLLVLLAVLLVLPRPATAQEEPTVIAVLFYSPTCPHCHKVIQEDLPPLQTQYGEQLELLFINIKEGNGSDLLFSACQAYNIPTNQCGGVPMMVVGTHALMGSQEIPQELPFIIEQGLVDGGLPLPRIPGLQAVYDAAASTDPADMAWQDRFQEDWLANSLAVGVLLALVLSLMWQLWQGWHWFHSRRLPVFDRQTWQIALGVLAVTVVLSITLLVEQEDATLLVAIAITALLTIAAGLLWRVSSEKRLALPPQTLPLLAVVGLLVAGYLTYIEMGENDPVCGAVGNCNLVQQSDYAHFLGLVPIGVLGLMGYGLILMLWSVRSRLGQPAEEGLFLLILLGAVFSIYLTFLEPFVIGATCIWCLTSALLMLVMLWIEAPQGWTALKQHFAPAPPFKHR